MRRSALPFAVVVLTLACTVGCAAGPSAATGASGATSAKTDLAMITREQIQELRFANAYDAVKGLRATWLSTRGAESFRYPTEVQVYVDGVHFGAVETLQNIPSQGIQYIQHFNGLEATSRWGIDHGRGVIFVSTRPQRPGASAPPPAPPPSPR